MKKPDNIIDEMVEIMPFELNERTIPYIVEAMEVYAKIYHKEQVSKLPIHGVSGRFYSDTEIAILKEECYQDGIEEGEMNI